MSPFATPPAHALLEYLGVTRNLVLEILGRLPTGFDGQPFVFEDPVAGIVLEKFLQGATVEEVRAWLAATPEGQAHAQAPEPPPPPPAPAPIARGPLGPFDRATTDPQTGAPLPVSTQLREPPPPPGTLRWWRGNAFGVTVPGLPAVAGGQTGPAQERMLTWFLDRFSADWQDRILAAHVARGYDRFVLSWPDSRGAAQSIRNYVATTQRVQDAGLLPCHMLLSKVYDGTNPDPAGLDPVIDALREANLIPLASIGWELNLFNDPGHLQHVIDHVAGRLPITDQRALYVHFSPHYAAWQPDRPGGSGADFWKIQSGKLTGLLYQGNPDWSVGMLQARLNDVLVRLVQGGLWGLSQSFDVVAFETIATLQFNNQADEDRGDLVGFESLCAPGGHPVQGFGNGARYPDGSPL